ncbi:MAG: hypothetical protein ABI746_01230 [Dermatophilaceae bacterium]
MTADDAKRTTAASSKPDQSSGRHAGVVAPAAAWAFAFLILRIFAVSGYNWDTAFAVSTTIGLDDGLSLLFGSLMAGHLLVAMLLICVLPLLLAAFLWGPRGHRPVVVLSIALAMVTLVALTVSFHSWWLPLSTFAALGAFALIRRLPPRHRLRRASMAAMVRVVWVAGAAVLFVAALIQTPWVPREQIQTIDGTITGYVLSVDSGYLNVLTDDREFVILLSDHVLSRN